MRVTFGWLSEHSGEKNFMQQQISRNQPIVCFDVILQHDWPIEQHLLYTKVFFDRITQRRCFDLFIHWLIKQQTRTETTFQGHMKISLINY